MYMFDLLEKPIFDMYIYGFMWFYPCFYAMCCCVCDYEYGHMLCDGSLA